MFWLKYRVKGERGRCSREVPEKEAGVVDSSQSENSSVHLTRVWTGPVDSREPSRIYKQGSDMLRHAF